MARGGKRRGPKKKKTAETADSIPKTMRIYQAWKGNNKFFCGGRLIFGPDVASIPLTTTLIAAPCLAFCSQLLYRILTKDESNPEESNPEESIVGRPLLISTAIISLFDFIFLYLTSSRDPGIVPRNSRPPPYEEGMELDSSTNSMSMDWMAHGRIRKIPRTKSLVVDNVTVKVKYCDTCLLYRPPRASHCSICDNCVQKFDHHCPWVGQCIGLRNYRFFFMFISTSTFLCIYIFIFSWLNIIEQTSQRTLLRAMKKEVLSLILIAYTFVSVWFVGGLTIFHFYLISTNQTTYENFRYRYDKKENPYRKSMLQNFREVFFSQIPASMNRFRSWAINEEAIEVVCSMDAATGNHMNDTASHADENCKPPADDGNSVIPRILQELDDYATSNESLRSLSRTSSIDSNELFSVVLNKENSDQVDGEQLENVADNSTSNSASNTGA